MGIVMKPIGYAHTDAKEIPRSWKVSDVEGTLDIDEIYFEGLRDLKPGQRIFVLFHFHKSPEFSENFMRIRPPVHNEKVGVFNTHSPFRPNPIGMSLLEVLDIKGTRIQVKGIDMMDETPILDIKPESCPWR